MFEDAKALDLNQKSFPTLRTATTVTVPQKTGKREERQKERKI